MSKSPYCIQRMSFKQNPIENPSIDGLLGMDYMGAAEFEYGSLPSSLKRLCKGWENLIVASFAEYTNYEGLPLVLIAKSKQDIEGFAEFIPALLSGTHQLKCGSYLEYQIKELPKPIKSKKAKKQPNQSEYYLKTNAWWEIDHDIFICFGVDRAEKIRQALLQTRENKKKIASDPESDKETRTKAKEWFNP